MSSDSTDVDPITLEVINNRIDEAVREMQHVMFRTGYSTIIRDSKDGSAGICLADGRVIGQAFRLPLHCGVFPPTIENIHGFFDEEEIRPGDVFLANDPYFSGANHTSDILIAVPVFREGKLQMFCTSIAHKPDLGGLVSGTMSPDATEIYHEGVLLPPVKYRDEGELNTDLVNIIRNNSRTPDVTMGDIRGQVGCTTVGADKVGEILERYGAGTVQDASDTLIRSTNEQLSGEIRDWDGTRRVSGELDSVPGGAGLLEITLTLSTNEGEGTIRFDFEGTSQQSEGPANMQPHVVKSACYLALVGMVDPSLPLNAAFPEVCEFHLPEGSVVHPTRPAPCSTYTKGMCVVVHLALRALSAFAPEHAIAESSNTGSFTIRTHRDRESGGENVVLYDFGGGGFGGHATGDGLSCMASTYKSNVQFPSLEILETEFPHRATEFSVRTDSAGAGEFRGGMGFIREYRLGGPSQVIYRGSFHEVAPRGVSGGDDAQPASATVNPGTDDAIELSPIETVSADEGDHVRAERPGGGGYGDPYDRDPDRVLGDVRDGFVSIDAAREDYGVVIRETESRFEIDREATRRRRESD